MSTSATDALSPPAGNADRSVDVLIVGAGISGIDAAYRVQERCPDLTYAVLEARERLGGTWDLFRYPGIRSDSDFFTLSFPFAPWKGRDAIVDGPEILDYLRDTARRFAIDRHITFNSPVRRASWDTTTGRWTVTAGDGEAAQTWSARFLLVCSGYYDYESPYDPNFAGADDFTAAGGTIVHPQFWPEDLDVAGKKVVVIGSGATAITLLPSLVKQGAVATMLQRTPSYVLAQPRNDVVADKLRQVLPEGTAHRIVRAKNTGLQWLSYQVARRAPGATKKLLRKGAIAGLGDPGIVEDHFTPPYDPWDQRLCVAPGGDFFAAIKSGRAKVVTNTIDRFVPEGIRLSDGTVLDADIVVTATGLTIKLLGGIGLEVDGRAVNSADCFAYRGSMLSDVPNFGFIVGYVNLSWTVRADMTARLLTRVIRRLADGAHATVTPKLPADVGAGRPLLDMQSGYLARAADLMPRATSRQPWTLAQNVVVDAWATNRADLDDGLEWAGTSARARARATEDAAA